MIKKFLIGVILVSIAIPAHGQSFKRAEIRVLSKEAGIDITTKKVARFFGVVDDDSYGKFKVDMIATKDILGDRVVLINSPGGSVEHGNKMIALMKAEQAQGVRVICIATKNAHSMAFNFLSQCNVRLMTEGTMSLVHKIRRGMITEDATAKNLRKIADGLEKDDEPFRQANAAAMHLSLKDYDMFADEETYFTAETLLKMKYLQGIANLEK